MQVRQLSDQVGRLTTEVRVLQVRAAAAQHIRDELLGRSY